jgi:hypothetical protein
MTSVRGIRLDTAGNRGFSGARIVPGADAWRERETSMRLVQHQEIQNLSNKIAELTTSLKATEVRAQALQQQEKTLTGQNQGTRNQTSYDYGIVRFQNHDTGPG